MRPTPRSVLVVAAAVLLVGGVGLAVELGGPDPSAAPTGPSFGGAVSDGRAPSSSSTAGVQAPSDGSSRGSSTTATPVVGELERHDLWVFPGPAVFAGDVVDLEVPTGTTTAPDIGELEVRLDGEPVEVEPVPAVDPIVGGRILLHAAIDTADLTGEHRLTVTGTVDDAPLARERTIEVRPAAERPADEAEARWTTTTTDCCTIAVVRPSGAADALDGIVDELDRIARDVAARFDTEPDGGLDVVLLDTPWGNGGFASGELVVLAVPDRDPSPSGRAELTNLLTHELTHAYSDGAGVPLALGEGLAVHVAGGHYRTEPLRAHAAALDLVAPLPTLAELADGFRDLQHERRYTHTGAFVTWLVQTHDFATALAVHDSSAADEDDDRSASERLEDALLRNLGTGIADTQAAFDAWLATTDPGTVATATELVDRNVALQELRRRWQREFAPWEALYDVLGDLDDRDRLAPVRVTRRASTPEHVAVERVLARGQRALAAGDTAFVDRVLEEVGRVVHTGRIEGGLVGDHLLAARFLASAREHDPAR